MGWSCKAKRDFPLDDGNRTWEGGAALEVLLDHYGSAEAAAVACLFYNPELSSSEQLKCPFCDVVEGQVKAIPGGLSACRERLDQTDVPDDVRAEGQAVLDAYASEDNASDSDKGDSERGVADIRRKQIPSAVAQDAGQIVTDAQGRIKLILSDATIDSEDEVLVPTGLVLRRKNIPWLAFHDAYSLPIGRIEDIGVADGEVVGWGVPADDPAAPQACRDAIWMVRNGFLPGISVGFRSLKVSDRKVYPQQRGATVEEWELLEGSSVPVPANPNAGLASKALEAEAAGISRAALMAVAPEAMALLQHREAKAANEGAQFKGHLVRARERFAAVGYHLALGDQAKALAAGEAGRKALQGAANLATAFRTKAYNVEMVVTDENLKPAIDAAAKLGRFLGCDWLPDYFADEALEDTAADDAKDETPVGDEDPDATKAADAAADAAEAKAVKDDDGYCCLKCGVKLATVCSDCEADDEMAADDVKSIRDWLQSHAAGTDDQRTPPTDPHPDAAEPTSVATERSGSRLEAIQALDDKLKSLEQRIKARDDERQAVYLASIGGTRR